MNKQPHVAIIGAGVAGLAVAWLLSKQGWRCTLIEKAPDLRAGGYMMGLSGPGYTAAGRMGLLPDLIPYDRMINENIYHDRHGKELLRIAYSELLQGMNWVTLARTDLVAALYKRVTSECPQVTFHFNCNVESYIDDGEQVTLFLNERKPVNADLLIGADGVNSQLRPLLFGDHDEFSEYMGYQVAGFQAFDHLQLGHDFLSYAEPGCLAEFYKLFDERMATLYVWHSDEPIPEGRAAKVESITKAFANSHSRALTWLEQLPDEEPLFFDNMRMITLPRWSRGRVMLMGDAAHCLTLLSGQGAGMALASAYILSQQLLDKTIPAALEEHEKILRPAILRLQARSRKLAPWFIPNSKLSFHLRNVMMRSLPRKWMGNLFLKSIRSDIEAAAEGLDMKS